MHVVSLAVPAVLATDLYGLADPGLGVLDQTKTNRKKSRRAVGRPEATIIGTKGSTTPV